ncbi:DNA double-strand break repair Rad50 ATPase [Bacillus thuringiensis serovar pingluonsis]|uniref:DNA double-strand break repair Rad50 ATPase n=1 Tax=Bacillus thuringiensis serovar pingluonsis TaxID=180881 RepID=A0A243BH15_BACTU|nr:MULTISPECIES: AAA family ATPase [Bacillus cereus group]MEB9681065.1 AAA family ATPase [Bacillus anthracis]OTY45719.1 DNA double-strand break repair Rad50 ATPase [Bacillus thuringiensis serovar pingluonsis]
MRMEKLHIYGYGKLENVEMDLSMLTVLYGENEAGKSTIRSFMKSILFGFPTRGQRRYEPKEGGKYGGAITVQTEKYGRLKIERLPKTAAGEVTVYFEDGKTGGEEILNDILSGMNESLFESVFSFDMHGLQNIHQLGEADIGNYLFSASAVGSDALLQLDKKLEKEMDQRFKPSGRKPEINVSLQEMKKLEEKMKEWQGKIGTYEKQVEQLKESEEKLAFVRAEKESAEKRKQDYEILAALEPLVIEKRAYEKVLENEKGQFPVNGMARYEAIKAKMEPLQLQVDSLHKKIETVQLEMESIQIDEEFLQKESYVEELRMQHMSYENARQEMRDITGTITNIKEELAELEQQIGATFEKETVLSFDMSLATKELITQAVQKARELETQKAQLDDRFKVAQEQLEEQEENIRQIQKQMLADEERNALVEKEKSFQDAAFIGMGAERMKRKYEEKAGAAMQKKKQWQRVCLLLLLINTGVLFTSLFIDNRLLLFTSVIVFVAIVLALVLYKDQSSGLQEELLTLQQSAGGRQSEEAMSVRYQLEKDEEIRKLFERESYKLQQMERAYDKVVSSYEEWERETFRTSEQVNVYKKRYTFPEFYTYVHILPAFERMEKMQQLYRELEKQDTRKSSLYEMISQFEHKLETVIGSAEYSKLHEAQSRMQNEKEKRQTCKQLKEKLAEWQEEYEFMQEQLKQLLVERDSLWHIAESTNEEMFLEAGKLAEKREDAEKQVGRLLPQIDLLEQRLTSLSLAEHYEADGYDEKLKQELTAAQNCLAQEKELTERIAKHRMEIANLEEGSTYGDLMHEWEMKKAQVREQVKKWAAYATAKTVLTKTKQYYHEVHLPRILQKSEEYFVYLTGGRYSKIFSPSEAEPFIVERNDGMRFYSHELSQATAEQLYLSLRFALAKTFEHDYPFIIDDSFVHFDAVRTNRTIELIKEIAKDRQVIFFTCHAHLLAYFTEKQIIKLTHMRKENEL